MELENAIRVASSGLSAQGMRLRVISENLANAESAGTTPGAEPYRRKIVTFRSVLDKAHGVKEVKTGAAQSASGDFERRYDPTHPAADSQGYVLMPNVNPMIEMLDMREAQQSYQANLNVIEAAKSMISRAIDLLHG
ncbi:MAG: flagellar basal body rod protein FlgC [Alphaproteobacteria bacterium]|nr:flagellar basal body rod protein FlgC [Alphaproteobacteria bacterium]